MSKSLYVEIKFVTLHQKQPADWENVGGSSPQLTINGIDVRSKYYLEAGFGDPGEAPEYDWFDYSEFSVAGASFERPSDYGAHATYQSESTDGSGITWNYSKYVFLNVPDDFQIPGDVPSILSTIGRQFTDLAEDAAVSYASLHGFDLLGAAFTSYGIYGAISQHINRQFALIDQVTSGEISPQEFDRLSTGATFNFVLDLAEASEIPPVLVDAVRYQAFWAHEDSGPDGLFLATEDGELIDLDYSMMQQDPSAVVPKYLSNANDGYAGTPLNDAVFGENGDDALLGQDGDDRMFGGSGEDYISLGRGNDVAYGEAGDDIIYGAEGDDRLSGGGGNDVLWGGLDADTLAGNNGIDTLWGESGDDILQGAFGRDYLSGGAGRDILDGGRRGDFLFGNRGIDFIDPGAGADQVDGGNDFDRVWYGNSAGGVSIDLTTGLGTRNDAAGDTYVNIERVTGSAFSDSIVGNELGNALKGGGGDDIVYGKDGRDVIEGQAGKDQLYGGGGNDNILGGDGNDRLFGNSGFDKLDGGAGNDQITGGADADYFVFETNGATGFGGDIVLDFQNGVDRLDMRGVYLTSDPGHAPIGFDDLAIGAWGDGVKIVVQNGQIVYLDHAATHITIADIDAGDFLFA